MCVKMVRVCGAQIVVAPAILLRQDRLHPAGIHDIVGVELALVREHLDAAGIHHDVVDARPLQHLRAIGDGNGGEQVVGILAVDVNLVAVGQPGDDGLQAAAGILRLARACDAES